MIKPREYQTPIFFTRRFWNSGCVFVYKMSSSNPWTIPDARAAAPHRVALGGLRAFVQRNELEAAADAVCVLYTLGVTAPAHAYNILSTRKAQATAAHTHPLSSSADSACCLRRRAAYSRCAYMTLVVQIDNVHTDSHKRGACTGS